MDRWLQTFQADLEATAVLGGGQRILVGVSGGPDSVCLLELFCEWAREGGSRADIRLLVGHVHHGIRGGEADDDAEFVRQLARQRGLEFLCERGDARALSERLRTSLQAAGRALRYATFSAWAAERRLDCVALGHHLDDQTETVLLRAIRGCGLRGLAGMPRRRSLFDAGDASGRRTVIVRPLMAWRRADILSFLAERGLEWRRDSTNDDRRMARNRLRGEILPALEATQPGAAVSLARLGAMAREAHADLRRLGERALGEALRPASAGEVVMDGEALATWPKSVLREVFSIALERARRAQIAARHTQRRQLDEGVGVEVTPRLSAAFLSAATAWLRAGGKGAKVLTMGGGVEADLRYGRIRLRPSRARGDERSRGACEVGLALPRHPGGSTARAWDGWELSLRWQAHDFTGRRRAGEPPGTPEAPRAPAAAAAAAERQRPALEPRPAEYIEWFDLDVLESYGPVTVRARRQGDVFHPLGAPGRKRLKELFRECGICPHERHLVPLFTSGGTIQWVVGCRMGHLARCRETTRRVLVVRALKKDG